MWESHYACYDLLHKRDYYKESSSCVVNIDCFQIFCSCLFVAQKEVCLTNKVISLVKMGPTMHNCFLAAFAVPWNENVLMKEMKVYIENIQLCCVTYNFMDAFV